MKKYLIVAGYAALVGAAYVSIMIILDDRDHRSRREAYGLIR